MTTGRRRVLPDVPWYWGPSERSPQPWCLIPPALRYALGYRDGGMTAVVRAVGSGWADVEGHTDTLAKWWNEFGPQVPNRFTGWGVSELRALFAVLSISRDLEAVLDTDGGGFARMAAHFRVPMRTLIEAAGLGMGARTGYVGGKTAANLWQALQKIAARPPARRVLLARTNGDVGIPRDSQEANRQRQKPVVVVQFVPLFTVTPLWLPVGRARTDRGAYRKGRPQDHEPTSVPDAVEITLDPMLRNPGRAAPAIAKDLLERLDRGAAASECRPKGRFLPQDLLFALRIILGARPANRKEGEVKALIGKGKPPRDLDARVLDATGFFREVVRSGSRHPARVTLALAETLDVLVNGGVLTADKSYAAITLKGSGEGRYVVSVAKDMVFRRKAKK
jgi:hypothetical protein